MGTLTPDGTDWGRRRRALAGPWLVPADDGTAMHDEMLTVRAAQRAKDPAELRESVSLLLWALVPGGDHSLATQYTSQPNNARLMSDVRLLATRPRSLALVKRWADSYVSTIDSTGERL